MSVLLYSLSLSLSLLERYATAFAAISEQYKWIKITGQLVLHDTYAIHVIECPPDAFGHIITILNEDLKAGLFRPKVSTAVEFSAAITELQQAFYISRLVAWSAWSASTSLTMN